MSLSLKVNTMATVKAFSVCKSSGGAGASGVFSYSPSQSLQDGSALAFDAATPEDAMRTGLSQAYSHGGVACTDTDALQLFQNEGLTPTLINPPNTTGLAASVALTTAGSGNANYPNSTVICSTTNLDADNVGAGLIIRFATTAAGVPTGTPTIVSAGAGYKTDDSDDVGIDGFPGSVVSVNVT